MRAERQLLRIGEYLIGLACRRLPQDLREERYREWAAELPAILHDPQVRFAVRRAVGMLAYAADTIRGTVTTPVRAQRPAPQFIAALYLSFAMGVIALVTDIWPAVRAPGHPLNSTRLAFSLLFVAYPISRFARSPEYVSTLIVAATALAGVGLTTWNAARAPGDWVNYFLAALGFLLLLAMLLVGWARTRRG